MVSCKVFETSTNEARQQISTLFTRLRLWTPAATATDLSPVLHLRAPQTDMDASMESTIHFPASEKPSQTPQQVNDTATAAPPDHPSRKGSALSGSTARDPPADQIHCSCQQDKDVWREPMHPRLPKLANRPRSRRKNDDEDKDSIEMSTRSCACRHEDHNKAGKTAAESKPSTATSSLCPVC